MVSHELTEGRVGTHFHKEMPHAKILLSFFRNSQQVFCAWSAPQCHEQHGAELLMWSHHPMLEESGLNLHSDRNCFRMSPPIWSRCFPSRAAFSRVKWPRNSWEVKPSLQKNITSPMYCILMSSYCIACRKLDLTTPSVRPNGVGILNPMTMPLNSLRGGWRLVKPLRTSGFRESI